MPERIGYLKSLGLEYGWGPTAGMEWILEHIHVYAGTPWWVSIALTALAVRVVMFKPFMGAADNGARMQAVKPITDPLNKEMLATRIRGDEPRVLQLRAEIQTINRRAGIKILKGFVPLLQIFPGYGTFVLLRAMGKVPVPGLETGGILWFHNLTIADPYFILPATTALALHWVLRVRSRISGSHPAGCRC
jgi:YidC/Oxa1 family membrane protein insertase